jgi:hypothetical protein
MASGLRGHSFPDNSPENRVSLSYQQRRMKDFDFHLNARYKSLEHWQEHSEVRKDAPSKK